MTGPAPYSDKERDRRVTLRSAVIALSAALTAAIIAAGSSYLTAQVQVNGQAHQTRNDFLRSQRQIAYAQFLEDEKTVFNAFSFYVEAVAGRGTSDSNATDLYNKAIDAHNDLTAAGYVIQLVGSDQCVDAVTRFVTERSDHLHQMFEFQTTKEKKKSSADFDTLVEKVRKVAADNRTSSLDGRINLLSCARVDIGN